MCRSAFSVALRRKKGLCDTRNNLVTPGSRFYDPGRVDCAPGGLKIPRTGGDVTNSTTRPPGSPSSNPQQYHPGKTRDRPCSEPGFSPGMDRRRFTPGMRTRVSKPRDIPGKAHIPGFSWLLDYRYRRRGTARGDRPGIRPATGHMCVRP